MCKYLFLYFYWSVNLDPVRYAEWEKFFKEANNIAREVKIPVKRLKDADYGETKKCMTKTLTDKTKRDITVRHENIAENTGKHDSEAKCDVQVYVFTYITLICKNALIDLF